MDHLKESPPVIRDYLVYLETIMGRSPRTVNEYYLDLRTFFRYVLQSRGLCSPSLPFEEITLEKVDLGLVRSVTRSEILDFLVFTARQRPKHHKSPETTYGNDVRTRARKISALRGFYKYYCDKLQLIQENPTKSLDVPKPKKELPKYLTLRESLDLLEAIDGQYRERDYCIITLFLNCGMRVSELCGINIHDIRDNQLKLLGKGNKERIVYLNGSCLTAIENYLKVLNSGEKIKRVDKNALFLNRFGKRISTRAVEQIVEHCLKEAGLDGMGISPHKLRHTAATLLYQDAGVDIRVLKELLGHESLSTTEIYTHVSNKQIEDASNKSPL